MSEGIGKPLLAWCSLAGVIALVLWMRWPGSNWLATDFQQLLPAAASDPWQVQAGKAAASNYDRQLVLFARGAGARDFLSDAVAELDRSGFVDSNFEAKQAQRWRLLAQHLEPFSAGLLTIADYTALANDPGDHLAQFRAALYSPIGGQWLARLPQDPLGLFHNFLSFNLDSRALTTAGVELAVVQLPQNRVGFSALDGLYSLHTTLQDQAATKGIEYHALGSPLYTSFGVESGRREISTVGVISMTALVTLLTVGLRSPMGLLVTFTSVCAGVAGGFAVTLACFQQIHIIALVFGSTLIGIAADYAFHYLCHSMLPGWKPREALGKVLHGLSLSVGSTALAFLTLTLIPFPGLQQIGLFMAAGLFCAYATVCLLFPLLYRKGRPGSLTPPRKREFSKNKFPPLAMGIIVTAISLPGIIQLVPRDEVRDFYAAPPKLKESREAISAAMGNSGESSYLLLKASSEEELLQLEENLVSLVPGLRPGITGYVPSQARQERNRELLQRLLEEGVIQAHMESLGLGPSAIENYSNGVISNDELLRLENLDGLDLPIGSGGFLGCHAESCASWLALGGGEPEGSLAEAIKRYPGAMLVQPVSEINTVVGRYREWAGYFLIATALFAGFLLWRFIGAGRTVQVLLLPVGACALSLAVRGYVDGGYTIVSILALFIVGGMALDFGIFLQLSVSSSRPATRLAIALSAISTLLAFGTLSLSATPIIAEFGFTIGSGLLFAWLLSLLIETPRNE